MFTIEKFVNGLKKISFEEVYVVIIHKLYGNQKLKCILSIIFDNDKIGFLVNNEELYIYKKEIQSLWIDSDGYHIAGQVMDLHIKKAS